MTGKTGELHPSQGKDSYYQVPVNLYQTGDLIEEDLYFYYQGNYLLYRLKHLPWRKEDRSRLDEFGVTTLFIRALSPKEHEHFLETHLSRIMDEPNISQKEKAKILYSTAHSIVQSVFSNPQSPDNLRRSLKAVKHSIDYIERDKQNFFELMSLAQRDFSEYTHALHTAAYAITLAKQRGVKVFNQLSAIGIAAILHDIGKSKISPEILQKDGRLNDDERYEIERHPIYSYEIVHAAGSVPELSEQIILQHHERPDGKGYPKKLGDDIHEFSKILSLCDCFDLMTTERTYLKALSPMAAVESLRTMPHQYDQELLYDFIKMLKR